MPPLLSTALAVNIIFVARLGFIATFVSLSVEKTPVNSKKVPDSTVVELVFPAFKDDFSFRKEAVRFQAARRFPLKISHENSGQKQIPMLEQTMFFTAAGLSLSKIMRGSNPAWRQNLSHIQRSCLEPMRLIKPSFFHLGQIYFSLLQDGARRNGKEYFSISSKRFSN